MAVMPRMYGQEIAQQANAAPSSLRVTPDLGTLAIDNIMGGLWARCGLTGRERSLVTLTIVMASRANSQIAEHIRVGMRNGLTQREIEEVIYQVGGYAGVPQAANAREVLIKVLDERRQKSEGR